MNYKIVIDNAKAGVVANALNNIDDPVTFEVLAGLGSRFPDTADGEFWITVYRPNIYIDPFDDPQMEVLNVTERVGDQFTADRNVGETGGLHSHTSGTEVRLLVMAKHIRDLQEANIYKVQVDTDAVAGYIGAAYNEGVLRSSSPLTYLDGGDFITLGWDSTLVGTTTWGSGSPFTWVFDVPGANVEMAFEDGFMAIDGDLGLLDDHKLYFDTAKTYSIRYGSAPSAFYIEGGIGDWVNIASPVGMVFYADVNADGSGTWEPYIAIQSGDAPYGGTVTIQNTTFGDAGNKFLRILMSDGIRLNTTSGVWEDPVAIILADNIAASNKTFQFPNASGTIALLEPSQTWGSGSPFIWTFDASGGTDVTIAFGDASITLGGGNLILPDNTYLEMGHDDCRWVMNNGNFGDGVFILDGASGGAIMRGIGASGELGLWAYTDSDGNGVWEPSIILKGSVHYGIYYSAADWTIGVGISGKGHNFVTNTMSEAASGVHPVMSNVAFMGGTLVNAGAATTNTANVYIQGLMSGDVTPTEADWSLFIDAGNMRLDDSLYLQEKASADGDLAGLGQIWVKDDEPNTLWFTDDAGTAFQLGSVTAANVSVADSADYYDAINAETVLAEIGLEETERESTGLISGGAITDNGGLNINVASGVAYVNQGGKSKRVTWNAFANQATADDEINYVAIDANGALDISTTEQDHDQYVLLGVVFTADVDIIEIHSSPREISQIVRKQTDFTATQGESGNIVLSGGIASINGASNRKIDVTNFTGFHLYKKFSLTGSTPITFSYWYQDGAGGWTEIAAQDTINNTQYDDGDGALGTMTDGYWRADELFISATGDFHILLGQAEYPNKNLVRTSPIAVNPDFLNGTAWHLYRIIIRKNAPSIVETLDYRRRDLQVDDRLNWNAKVENPLSDDLDCNNQYIQNFVIETVAVLGAAAAFPGRVRRLSTDGKIYGSDGNNWINLMGGGTVRSYIYFGMATQAHSP